MVTRTWNTAYEAIPAVGDDARDGAQRIQDLKLDLSERLNLDHSWDPAAADDANDGYHEMVTLLEQSSAPAGKANAGRFYTLDVNGVTELHYKDSGGNGQRITSGGGLRIRSGINEWSAGQRVKTVVLTPGTTVTPDCDDGNLFRLTPAQNFTLADPANTQDGFVITIGFKQDGTGSRIITYGSKWKFPTASIKTLSTGANEVDTLSAWYNSDFDIWMAQLSKNYV